MACYKDSLDFIKTEDDMEADEQELEVSIFKVEPINHLDVNELSIVTHQVEAAASEEPTYATDAGAESSEDTIDTEETILDSRECGVCGATSKYKHFGAICCDSCKSFFRRSVQTNIWPIFFCITGGQCDMRADRRSCKSCRFHRCKQIGMEMSLVMSSEDREALMSRRTERQMQLALDHQRFGNRDQPNLLRDIHHEHCSQTAGSSDWNDKTGGPEGRDDDSDDCSVIEYLSVGDKTKLQSLQKALTKAHFFPDFSQHFVDDGDNSIIEQLFFCFCKNMGNFFNSIPEFRQLETRVQKVLLKPAIAKSIFIFGTYQYDQNMECWPKRLLTADCTFPTIPMSTVEKFVDNKETMHHWKTFMGKFNDFYCEENITILALIIAMFDHMDAHLLDSSGDILGGKSKYIELLKRYVLQQSAQISISVSLLRLAESLADVEYLKCCFQNSATKEDVKAACQGENEHSQNTCISTTKVPQNDRYHSSPLTLTFPENSSPDVGLPSHDDQSYVNDNRSVTNNRMTASPMMLDHDYLKYPEQDYGNAMKHSSSYELPGVIRTKELIIRPLPLDITKYQSANELNSLPLNNTRHQSGNVRRRENSMSDVNHSRNRIDARERVNPCIRSEFSTNIMGNETKTFQERRDALTPAQQKLLKQLHILNSSPL